MRRECRERFPRHRLQWKPPVNDPGMHHGTCVTHVPWCMPGSLTCAGRENVPGIPGACATRNFTYLIRSPLHNRCWSRSKVVLSVPPGQQLSQSPGFAKSRVFRYWTRVLVARATRMTSTGLSAHTGCATMEFPRGTVFIFLSCMVALIADEACSLWVVAIPDMCVVLLTHLPLGKMAAM